MKKIKALKFKELTKEQQKECIEAHRDINNDIMNDFLSEDINHKVESLLKKAGYKNIDIKVKYSLNYCQGDGLSFEGTFEKHGRQYEAIISNAMNYVHAYMMDVVLVDGVGDGQISEKQTETCRNIALEAEKFGYNIIENMNSDEAIKETLEANEYHFITNLNYAIV